jgi:hypothetical protein
MSLHGLLSDVSLLEVDVGLLEAEAGVHVVEPHAGPQELEAVVVDEEDTKDAEVANVPAVSSTPILFQRRLLALK